MGGGRRLGRWVSEEKPSTICRDLLFREQVGRAQGQGRSPHGKKFQEGCLAVCVLRRSWRGCGTQLHRQPPGAHLGPGQAEGSPSVSQSSLWAPLPPLGTQGC